MLLLTVHTLHVRMAGIVLTYLVEIMNVPAVADLVDQIVK
jgi:hypothetical protein